MYDPFDDDDDEEFEAAPDDAASDYGTGEGDNEEGLSAEQIAAAIERFKEKIFAPKPFNLKPTKKTIAVVDTETDPFSRGLVIKPFALGFRYRDRDGAMQYEKFWGDDCVEQFFDRLAELTADGYDFIIYAHNGGKFDFFFFLKYLTPGQTPLIMNGRLVKIVFAGQEFRDSFAIIPQPLSAYKKDEIDYAIFKRAVRERHKAKILAYLETDCIYTYELIDGFHEMFGDKVTIASASLPMLNSYHGFQKIKSEQIDDRFRKYYFGGRNQCFETGILKASPGKRWQLIDRNSMYPAAMKDELHPISATFDIQKDITYDSDFACIEAENFGALPLRSEDGSLDFTRRHGVFHATMHEIRAGLDTGTLRIKRVRHAWRFHRKASFAEFVDRFYGLRIDAKNVSDKVRDILYKFVLNSGYGKFALNPRKFKQWALTIDEIPEPQWSPSCPDGWSHHSTSGPLMIWSRPNPRRTGFYNIATAASITGAARANLLRNLALSSRPIYCDTDSILCENFTGELGAGLGQWDLEATGDTAAIAGKKLYAIFDSATPEFGPWKSVGKEIKKASKGVNLSPTEIMAVCSGEEIIWKSEVPTFKLGRDINDSTFLERRINMTGGQRGLSI